VLSASVPAPTCTLAVARETEMIRHRILLPRVLAAASRRQEDAVDLPLPPRPRPAHGFIWGRSHSAQRDFHVPLGRVRRSMEGTSPLTASCTYPTPPAPFPVNTWPEAGLARLCSHPWRRRRARARNAKIGVTPIPRTTSTPSNPLHPLPRAGASRVGRPQHAAIRRRRLPSCRLARETESRDATCAISFLGTRRPGA
jgi:hypothetical protein